jgi:hypothetical protein
MRTVPATKQSHLNHGLLNLNLVKIDIIRVGGAEI